MIIYDALITFASWEDRYLLGFEKNMHNFAFKKVFTYYYSEYSDRTKVNRDTVLKICAKKKIIVKSTEIKAKSPADAWRTYQSHFTKKDWTSKNVLIDISTMPRDSIWSIFFFLENASANVDYVYYKPKRYNDTWLSRDPDKPRLVFKQSGIAQLGNPTGLIIVTGFDADRTLQLINFFEPKLTLLGIQSGSQFESNNKNLKAHKTLLKGQHNINTFKLDAYSKDHGQAAIEREMVKYFSHYNVIMSSLGPKPSAVALYKVCRKYPEVALSYAPSKEFNIDYSHGLGKKYGGRL